MVAAKMSSGTLNILAVPPMGLNIRTARNTDDEKSRDWIMPCMQKADHREDALCHTAKQYERSKYAILRISRDSFAKISTISMPKNRTFCPACVLMYY